MNKEQFLAMSINNGLKFMHFHCGIQNKIADIDSNILNGYFRYVNTYNSRSRRIIRLTSLRDYSPILHPLSDLTKEIEHKGGKFVPIEKLQEMNDGENIYIHDDFVGIDNGYACAYYLNDALKFVSVLIEWHFDIAGLIDKGEAIDVNTLPENPYN